MLSCVTPYREPAGVGLHSSPQVHRSLPQVPSNPYDSVNPNLTEAGERPAANLFGSAVTRKKLNDSGQSCVGTIFTFGLWKVESACYDQEKTERFCLHQEMGAGSAAGYPKLMLLCWWVAKVNQG